MFMAAYRVFGAKILRLPLAARDDKIGRLFKSLKSGKKVGFMKKLMMLFLTLACALSFTCCGNRSMNDIIANEPNITGIVTGTIENAILVENENGEYWVSLAAENKDSMTHFDIGDEVVIYYDGSVAESYPMQIHTVYAITLKTPADRAENTETQNETLKYLEDKYGGIFKLWGPEGNDLYAFYIYPDHAEWECHILMPANTDDIAQYQDDLSWKIAGEELIIRGAGSEETFRIDIAAETATSATTGKVYQICAME